VSLYWYATANVAKEVAKVGSQSALLDTGDTLSESNENSQGVLQSEAPIESKESHHDTADNPILGPESSTETAPLDQTGLQDEEGLATEGQQPETASISAPSTNALSVCFLGSYHCTSANNV